MKTNMVVNFLFLPNLFNFSPLLQPFLALLNIFGILFLAQVQQKSEKISFIDLKIVHK